MSRLIGVAGYARVGKDEVGKCLAKRGFTVTRFSQVLKDEVLARMPRTLDAIARLHDAAVTGPEPWPGFPGGNQAQFRRWLVETAKPAGIRELLQEYGTEVRRGDDPDYWVKEWRRVVDPLLNAGRDVCVVDVRFPNEAEMVEYLGGELWRVERPGYGPLHDHASEKQDFGVKLSIHNHGSLADLDCVVHEMLAC